MSEQLQKELDLMKQNFNYVRAKLLAGEQFTNGLLKDVIDSKTTINIYSESLTELNQKTNELEEEIKKLKVENAYLREELNGLKSTAQPDTN